MANNFDELRERLDPKDISSIAAVLNLVIDALENIGGNQRPLNNPEPINAPPIDDSVRTVVV
jgi:hypothetical protein